MVKQETMALFPRLRFPEFGSEPWVQAQGGKLFDQISKRNAEVGLPILAITQEHGAIPRDLIDYHVSVSEKSIESYKVVESGDFIISLRSFQGGIEYSNYGGICSPAYVILRKKGGGCSDYFRHLFKSASFIRQLTRNIEGLRDGKMISYRQFSDQLIPAPKPAEQKKIADCLTSLDEVIGAQGRKVEALKAHKRGLMQQLFPREGETRPRLRFPEFRDADEWERKGLASIAAQGLTNGVFNNAKAEAGTYRLINVREMYLPNPLVETDLAFAQTSKEEAEKKLVCYGDVFFTRSSLVREGIAYSNIYIGSDGTTTFDGHVIRLRPNRKIVKPLFLHYALKTDSVRSQLVSRSKTATMTTIGQNDVAETMLSIPRHDEQRRIAGCLSSLDTQITAESNQLNALKIHKQGLMQQLFPAPDTASA